MRIIIDMDNTICRTNEYFFYNCKARFGKHNWEITKNDFRVNDYHITEWFTKNNMATEIEAKAMKEIIFDDPAYWASIPPMEDAIEIIGELSWANEILIASDALTVTNEACMIGKKRWMKRFMPNFKFSNMIFTSNKSLIKGDIIIEDVGEQVIGFDGIKILFNYPYNRDFAPDFRVESWKEIHTLHAKGLLPR